MDEDLSIINANTRNEKIKNFFVNNRKILIFIITIFIFLVIGVYSYDKYLTEKKKDISDNFNSTTIEYSESSKDKTLQKLVEIINQKDSTYSPLSLYFIIDNKLISDHKEVNKLFDVLIEKTSLNEEVKNLVIYKKALFNADQVNEVDLLNMLNPLINSNSVWKSHALYLLGEFFYAQDQKQKAKEFFNQIITLESSNPDIKIESEKRLNRDLSE
tara:strand:- start:400 stop:1044 length:645 start_codon:yes stop_codon:yes gene_type:complete